MLNRISCKTWCQLDTIFETPCNNKILILKAFFESSNVKILDSVSSKGQNLMFVTFLNYFASYFYLIMFLWRLSSILTSCTFPFLDYFIFFLNSFIYFLVICNKFVNIVSHLQNSVLSFKVVIISLRFLCFLLLIGVWIFLNLSLLVYFAMDFASKVLNLLTNFLVYLDSLGRVETSWCLKW